MYLKKITEKTLAETRRNYIRIILKNDYN